MGKIRYCDRCGHVLTERSRFCENCGAPVAAEKMSSQQAADRKISQSSASRTDDKRMNPNRSVQQNRNPANPDRPVQQNRNRENPNRSVQQNRNRENPNRPVQQNRNPMNPNRPVQQNRNPMNPNRPGQPNPNRPGSNPMNPNRMNQQPQRSYPSMEEQRQARYRQDAMEKDWQQTWDRAGREEEEQRFTPLQYILIGLTVLLLIALIGFFVYWVFGRSDNRQSGERGNVQTEQVQTEQLPEEDGDVIQILDGGGSQTVQTGNTAVQQTEPMIQTEKQTEAVQDMVLTYPEFSLTLPGSWKSKYGITQSADSYAYYHQASKAQGYSGILFTITCYRDTSYKNIPNTQVLGLGNGTAYVYSAPSEVPYPQENQTIAEEYKRMSLDLGSISGRFRMLVSGEGPKETEAPQAIEIHESPNQEVVVEGNAQQQAENQSQQTVSSGGYIAESSQRLLTDADVAGMSYEDMQMAINEIYARHGRRFSSESIQSYFESQSWYSGTVNPEDFSESVFSSTEGQNIQFLLEKMGVQ